jgi:hypothetical protein
LAAPCPTLAAFRRTPVAPARRQGEAGKGEKPIRSEVTASSSLAAGGGADREINISHSPALFVRCRGQTNRCTSFGKKVFLRRAAVTVGNGRYHTRYCQSGELNLSILEHRQIEPGLYHSRRSLAPPGIGIKINS